MLSVVLLEYQSQLQRFRLGSTLRGPISANLLSPWIMDHIFSQLFLTDLIYLQKINVDKASESIVWRVSNVPSEPDKSFIVKKVDPALESPNREAGCYQHILQNLQIPHLKFFKFLHFQKDIIVLEDLRASGFQRTDGYEFNSKAEALRG